MLPSSTVSVYRATINRLNAQHSTGPRTEHGKKRSSLNATRHGLTARTAVIPSEDEADYQKYCRQFFDEYQPANPTETQMVQQLADTSWRLNRIPRLEAAVLAEAEQPQSKSTPQAVIDEIAKLGLHSSRLSRQFQKTLDQLREIQDERRRHERHQLRDAADLFVHNQRLGIPWDPADNGFVFSKERVQQFAERKMRQNEARHTGAALFDIPPQIAGAYLRQRLTVGY